MAKKLSKMQLLRDIEKASRKNKAIYDFHPGAKKMDFINLYCEGYIKPGGTNNAGWVITRQGRKLVTG